jgi:hypothetical protein
MSISPHDSKGREILSKICSVPRVGHTQIAAELEVATNSVRQWMLGVCKPGPDNRLKLQEVYGIPSETWDEPLPQDINPDDIDSLVTGVFPEETVHQRVARLSDEQVMRLRCLGFSQQQIASVVTILGVR